jgi:predicted transcriptional regulator
VPVCRIMYDVVAQEKMMLIALKVPPELNATLRQLADQQTRTFSNMVRVLLVEGVERHTRQRACGEDGRGQTGRRRRKKAKHRSLTL